MSHAVKQEPCSVQLMWCSAFNISSYFIWCRLAWPPFCSSDTLKGETVTSFTYVVVGIQHAGDVLGQVSVQNGLNVAANIDCKEERRESSFDSCCMVEKKNDTDTLTVFKVKVARSLCWPQPHGVDNVVSVAGDGGVIRQRQHHLSVPAREKTSVNRSPHLRKPLFFFLK